MSSRSIAKAADVLDRWYNLLEQEANAYKTANYLTTPSQTNDKGNTFDTDTKMVVCRSKLFAWMYDLVDTHSLDRELVAVAASYMDRYLSKQTSINRGYIYQLVGMTSLYLAIKIYRDQGKCAGAASFAGLSRGLFTDHDIVKMENSMLNTLDWRMFPPTAVTFGTMLLAMIPRGACSPFSRHSMFERIRFLLELSIAVPFFLGKKPSNIAIGAFIEIMESEEQPNVSDKIHQAHFKRRLYILAGIDSDSNEVTICRNAMKKIHQEAKVELKKKDAAIVSPEHCELYC
ncbi:cyclin family protein [Skeletonema marinoi]|uniref:Cyclin family protein n=1 Tax=Skeletonema marinoi TaxID=267567 RepID=A0AAD8Y9X6_9STRA|nr:cyclin family protein [Skeletonema marinoi]